MRIMTRWHSHRIGSIESIVPSGVYEGWVCWQGHFEGQPWGAGQLDCR